MEYLSHSTALYTRLRNGFPHDNRPIQEESLRCRVQQRAHPNGNTARDTRSAHSTQSHTFFPRKPKTRDLKYSTEEESL